ncbi:hydrogen peroxide-inducible genes activator [Bradyrhizobium sp. G127]|jgi:LysR family hydrogen peroxide-inducible transcriptional activator|uniref:hydrogen peroxide-inducible genes activator n=1 Tax=Bradyrhizobium sp. G127 TaxID=2904800 RepID=UPI001F1AAAF5|nr:hydrogen peroxide-inducible genes activator [Bradyrhizobium sp. G127]MCF2524054.1 hydrogen peroxide-inducible genes activator [Bradyrhizobium sp. G127]
MVSLKQLKYFDAVARSGHFGKAAAHCAISQPALSMQVQELERSLGVQLLERGRNGVILTEGGREIAQRAARVLADVRDIVDAARRQGDVLSGPLALGVIPSLAPYILPRLLPKIRDGFPDLDLHIRETQTQSLVGELVDGELDLLLLALPVEHPDVETVRLFDDRFLLAMATAHRMSDDVRATPDLLEGDKLLLLEEGHCMRDQALAFCNLQRVENINTFGASSLSTLVQMVANGLGMTLLPEIAVPLETRHGDIHLMRFADPEPQRVIGLAWRKSSPRKRHFVELGQMITDAASTAAR